MASDEGFMHGVIKLDAEPAVYYSGQIISGSVGFITRSPINFAAINVQYIGEGDVLWTESETETVNGVSREKEIKYQAHEEYFNYTERIAGGHGITELPPGHHTIPFTYQIPFNAPSSYDGEQGQVTYSVKATMIYSAMANEELETEFTVVAPLDLNRGNPTLKDPIEIELGDEYGCCLCFCITNPLTIDIKIPVSGWCPGQTIPVTFQIKNDSSVEIQKIVCELLKRELYRSRQPPSEYIMPEEVIATAKKGAVLSHSKRNFICELVVPDMIPAYMENCTIIDIGYFFRVTVKMSGCHDDLQEEAEICLGLVPLKETVEGEYKHPMAHSLPTVPVPIELALSESANQRSSFGSNHSLNRSRTNISQNNSPYPNYGQPYPGTNASYPGFAGSNSNINRSQQNIGPYQDLPPPYPGNQGYPTGNTGAYQIGFKAPFPGAAPITLSPYNAGNTAPYNAGNTAPYNAGNTAPYNAGNTAPYNAGNTAPYPQPGFVPSAPPATE